jgi:integrase
MLKKLFDEYIQECTYSRRLRSETLRSYGEVFKHFSKTMIEIDRPDLLNREVMTEFFRRLQTRKRIVGKCTEKVGIKNSTVKTYWSKLNAFFEWLRIREQLKENPLRQMKPPEPVYEDERALKRDDIEKILATVMLNSKDSFTLRRDTMMIYILVFCGLRKGEFISLQTRDVDLEKRIITVRAETSKSKKTRQVPLGFQLVMHIREYLDELKKKGYKTQHLIASSSHDKGLSRDGLKHWVNRLNILSGVKFHLHRFRHTFACNLANQNTSLIKIQKLMGHKDPKMTMVYLRSIGTDDLRSEVDRLSIDGLV